MAKLDYYNRTHKGLSYSRELTLNDCPRKYELDAKYSIKTVRSSPTFSYGHAVATGIQFAIAGHTFNRCIIETLLAYTHDVEDMGNSGEQSGKKSIWHAIEGVRLFCEKFQAGQYKFLEGWEVAKFVDPTTDKEMDAVELTFVVELVDDYSFEGHIDLILYHPVKQKFMVVELKTTVMTNVHEAQYQNSSQALGYGAVLDLMAADLNKASSFDVLYLVFQSRSKNLVPMPFTKTAKDRVDWLNSLMINVSKIELYETNGYPKQGQSCYNFFRACEYINTCGMTDGSLRKMYLKDKDSNESEVFQQMLAPTFMFTLDQLMDRQEQLIEQITSGKVSENSDAELLISTVLPD